MDAVDIKEKEILTELRKVSGKFSYQVKDILEWSVSPLDEIDGQKNYYLPQSKVYVAVEE